MICQLVGAWQLFGNLRATTSDGPNLLFTIEPNYALPIGVMLESASAI